MVENFSSYQENDLLMLVGAGDERAFSAIVAHYTPIIYAQLLLYLKHAQRAEEAVQDIFMSIWRNREKLPGMENFPGYVYVITRNKVQTIIKEKVLSVAEPPPDLLRAQLAGPESAVQLKELQQAVFKGIDRLPARRKEVFTLSRLENLTYEEIGERLGISRNAVKQHITEAMVFLRHYLKKELDVIVIALIWLSLPGAWPV
ncbi:RNA polymerase sigma factor [Chitinophaga sp. GCM10012297]|uniref:Sigma-70 family RNA polymerase sigma factor n=1 Tax=Chitinophaga chungangae TaxID=2821488 RepID=A0ABS3YGS1_9BACT|nr:sigma-70 family RNA polymerase sigma factor [Chitinophaga chungangae]MBO9153488.1 sigma-70 family RNA polymerase sigma factor [Chitinophaga chungangae]